MNKISKEERRANVVTVLNKARAMELQAIHQYMNQHYNLDEMDYGEMAANLKLIAIDMKLFEEIIDEEQTHFNYFDSVQEHIDKLGDVYLSKIAGTPSSTGLQPQGFTVAKA